MSKELRPKKCRLVAHMRGLPSLFLVHSAQKPTIPQPMKLTLIVLATALVAMFATLLITKNWCCDNTEPTHGPPQQLAPPIVTTGPQLVLQQSTSVMLPGGQQVVFPPGTCGIPTGQGLLVDYIDPATGEKKQIIVLGTLPTLPAGAPPSQS